MNLHHPTTKHAAGGDRHRKRQLNQVPENIIDWVEFQTNCEADAACDNLVSGGCLTCTTTVTVYLEGNFGQPDVRDAIQAIIDSPTFSEDLGLVEDIVFLQLEEGVQMITVNPTDGPTAGPTSGPTPTTPQDPGSRGDPHFKTWRNEHFEYHGQCDIVLAKDPNFANGLGLDVHIRTKLIRHWSYILSAVIRIGNDILEIQGTPDKLTAEIHYWINYEYQGELEDFAGFPVTMVPLRTRIDIDLDSIYPGQMISLSAFKEFVKVSFGEASEEAFGNTVGILGNYTTGATLSRDGVTVLSDFTELGQEWQVNPSDAHLFRTASSPPQFPELCIEPDDPRGDRARRLDESSVTEEQAEAACAGLKDKMDHRDCVYDILATQDMDMANAYE